MLGWWRRLTQGKDHAEPDANPRQPAVQPDATQKAPRAAGKSDVAPAPADISLTAWLLQAPQPLETSGPVAQEATLHEALQRMAHGSRLPDTLLPRVSAVIPQLLRTLRQEAPSRAEWVEKVAKDQMLTAEVLRMAHSAHFRTREPVQSLDGALSLIGHQGLKAAITRVVLKPILTSQDTSLAGRAAQRTWMLNEAMGPLCGQKLSAQGLEWFDGFLAGTAWGLGRTAALRTLDLAHLELPAPWSKNLEQAIDSTSRQLFGRMVAEWNVTPLFNEAATAFVETPAGPHSHPLCVALLATEQDFLTTQSG